MPPDPLLTALESVLDEMVAAQAHARRAAWNAAELEELAEEGEAGRDELADALAALATAETKLDALRLKRAEAEAELTRLEVQTAHNRRAVATDSGDEP